MSDELLGRRLRAERERRRITLESIATNTKISIGLLRALERDDLARWPTGIFRRSFVRTYAEAVGLDPDDTLREFLECHPDPLPEVTAGPLDVASAPPQKVAYSKTVLRLTLEDSPQPFSAGHLLRGAKSRLSAVAWDAGTTFVFAMTSFVIFENFWAPLAVFMIFYYLGSVLVLGNTPGVSLFAPGEGKIPVVPPETDADDTLGDLHPNALGHRATS